MGRRVDRKYVRVIKKVAVVVVGAAAERTRRGVSPTQPPPAPRSLAGDVRRDGGGALVISTDHAIYDTRVRNWTVEIGGCSGTQLARETWGPVASEMG